MEKQLKKQRRSLLFSGLVIFVLAVFGSIYLFLQPQENMPAGISPIASNPTFASPSSEELLRIIYIDVGQGDSALILTPDGKSMLIDAGESASEEKVAEVLEQYGVTFIDMLIATHPHSDHIGGMKYIVENFQIGQFCLPNVAHTSQTYEELLLAVQQKKIPTLQAKAGVSFQLGDDVSCSVLAPASDSYESLNDYSVVLHLSYGSTSFLFTGDAEALSEFEILASSSASPEADVLKVGHHGSRTSTSEAFLDAIHPKYAVISCGIGNSYGHPHTEILEALAERGITVYRTDELGDILACSDGSKISFAKAGAVPSPATDGVDTVYVTSSGKSYHRKNCQYYRADSVGLDLQEAQSLGYVACTRCFEN